jgi:hypothetical protein
LPVGLGDPADVGGQRDGEGDLLVGSEEVGMQTSAVLEDRSLRDLSRCAEGRARLLAANFGLDVNAGGDNSYFALAGP